MNKRNKEGFLIKMEKKKKKKKDVKKEYYC